MDQAQATRIEMKLDKVQEHLMSMDRKLASQMTQVGDLARRASVVERQLRPVEKHVERMRGAGKLIRIFATVSGLLVALAGIAKAVFGA
jgi:CII-binding regulator of phage lambda lysogenization HflD